MHTSKVLLFYTRARTGGNFRAGQFKLFYHDILVIYDILTDTYLVWYWQQLYVHIDPKSEEFYAH